MNRILVKETIHEIECIQDLLLSEMDYITELLRALSGDTRMLTRTPKQEAHLKSVVKKREIGKLVSVIKYLYISKKYV